MTETHRCPRCGTEMAADSPAGLCPECLLRQGLLDSQAGEATLLTAGFVPPAPEELARHFPQLEILELLGKGGMGAVYKARQKGLDRPVALKILPPEVGRDPAFAERFTREARALARLGHSNIVTVYDFGRADDLYYFLMEYVDGTNLRHLIQTGELSPQQALAVVPQICEALQFAHDEGVVHRDIKPENILLDKRGRVKIADFGLAKLLGRMPTDVTLTQARQVMGTLHYMAPEQIQRPLEVDHRADIYSLGVVFYEMLTRELPLGRFDPPSRRVRVDVRLDEVVMRALEREPQRRYQHASEVKTEVETICGLSAVARQRMFGQEYRSKTTIAGWPLVHIAFGINPLTGRKRVAKGVIAIGDLAIGGVAVGGGAVGGLAFGGMAAGLISSGGIAVGLLAAVGGLAVGGLSFGGMGVGVIALGGMAAGLYAYGGAAFGLHALGSNVRDPEAVRFFEPWADYWSTWLAGMGIVLPIGYVLLALIAWLVLYLQDRRAALPKDDSAVTEEVRGPATGLLITGILNWVGVPVAVLILSFVIDEPPSNPVLALVAVLGLVFSSLIIFGALKMMRIESYGAAVLAAVLAMLVTPGNLIGLPIGIWALVVLSSRQTRAAFNDRTHSSDPPTHSNSEDPYAPALAENATMGRLWWAAVDRFPNLVRGVLLVLYVLCFWAFFSSSGSGGPGFTRMEYTIGQPFPWYEFRFVAGESHHARLNLLSPAWLVALAAFGILHVLIQVRPGDAPVSRWEQPRTHAVVWFALALAGVSFGFVPAFLHAASAG